MEKPLKLDNIDIQLIEILQNRGETHIKELAEQTKLSLPAISERLKKLEERGIIVRYTAIVNVKALGFDVTAFVAVIVDSSIHYHEFIKHAASEQQILECHATTGEGTYLLKVRTQNTVTLEQLLSRIQSWRGVQGTRTSVVLSSPKETTQVPLDHLRH
jgi:Lrp/AsnC family transcriptional regulator, leucine-responsive regulatory protein